jgi:hypothetical protein
MQNTFPDWLFNVMLLGGIVFILLLAADALVTPILGAITALIALVAVLAVAAFWPKW